MVEGNHLSARVNALECALNRTRRSVINNRNGMDLLFAHRASSLIGHRALKTQTRRSACGDSYRCGWCDLLLITEGLIGKRRPDHDVFFAKVLLDLLDGVVSVMENRSA